MYAERRLRYKSVEGTHTEFRDNYANDTEFQSWIWKSLSNFSEEEQEQFLRFCWGRSRLPVAKDGWTHPFTVHTKRAMMMTYQRRTHASFKLIFHGILLKK